MFLGLIRLCEQNVLRTFTAADHKQPSSKSSSVSINKIQWFGSYWLGWLVSQRSQTITLHWLGWLVVMARMSDYSLIVVYQPTK